MCARKLKAVSIGGGTGQPRLIQALRLMGANIDSIVAMADDGGSTGLLREREHVVPPGDIRKCLSALAADPDTDFARAFAHRFPSIDDHALGNLLLVALAKENGSFAGAIRTCEHLLGCIGHVHPSTLELVSLSGRTREGDIVHGQAQISYGRRTFTDVWLEPAGAAANEEAVRAILDADLIVLGPGSLFTSIIPNLLVDGIREALHTTRAQRVFVCPKIDSLGETSGMSVADHVDALMRHGLSGALDTVLVHRSDQPEVVFPYEKRAWERVGDAVAQRAASEASREHMGKANGERLRKTSGECRDASAQSDVLSAAAIAAAKDAPFGPIRASDEDLERIRAQVPCVIVRDFTGEDSPAKHDIGRLAAALAEVVK